jgi:nucleoid-associated protein YgaU
MAGIKNTFLTWLAISNLFAFVIIFILFWTLWENSAMFQSKNITVKYVPQPALTRPPAREIPEPGPVEPSVKEEDLSIITAIAKEVKSNTFDTNERLNIEPVKINKTQTASEPFSDEEYIAAYETIPTPAKSMEKGISEQEATTVKASSKPADEGIPAQNRFNKVDLSKRIKTNNNASTLAQQVAQIAVIDNETTSRSSVGSNDNEKYLASLKEAEAERQNEMRTITVRRGDTLWKISTRAYGTGFLYQKVFKANPHLKSPDDITVGETLRVPL